MTRKRKIVLTLVLALVLIVTAVGAVLIHQFTRNSQLEEQRNEALEELERNIGTYDDQSIVLYQTSKANAEELASLLGAELRITKDGRFAKLTLPEGTTIRDVYADDANLEHIEKMAADYQVRIADISEEEDVSEERLPTRPKYTVSDSDYALQTYLDYLNMQDVWNYYNGSGVTVAVIDTGIDTDHPEFAGRISEYSYNATEDKIVKDWTDENGNYDWSLIEDEQGHGTAVTGVLAASMNGEGIVGIAPDVNIIVIKAECFPDGTFKRTSDLVFGLYYAIERDVAVVNMSFGTYDSPNPFAAATQLAIDSDIVCVAASGNDGTSALSWPAADPNVIGVGALAADSWELADYSNYGENTNLVAPGTTYTAQMGGGYGTMNGTSLASPVVAGAVALFMQNNPYIMVEDVTEVLYASSCDLGDLGRDWTYGFGALDMNAFIREDRGTITFDMLTDELENTEGLFIKGHTLQELPEPERLYAVFDGWYYDDTFTQEYVYYEDKFYDDITLYAKWVNEDDGVPFTYVELEDGTIEIRSYTGRRRFITIPEKIDGKIVSSIGEFAFAGQTRLREVGLPSGLITIKRYAFKGCSNLVSMSIPENVTSIGEYAFAENVRLSTIAFRGNSKLTIVGSFAFAECSSLKMIELPSTLEVMDGSALFGTQSLTSIMVQKENAVFVSQDGVLFNNTGSTLVAFPASKGTQYTLPEQTRVIGAYAFGYAKLAAIDLTGVATIGESAFRYSALESVTIPDATTLVDQYAFYCNSRLTSVVLGRNLTVIKMYAFAHNPLLTEITIPNNIQFIEGYAFIFSGLLSVTFESNSTLSMIGPNAFVKNNIARLDIPASVVEIMENAFLGNPLCEVNFDENSNLHSIGGEAFKYCDLLTHIELPKQLDAIGDMAFANTGLQSVVVPASVANLGNGVFAGCMDLYAIGVEADNGRYHDMDGVVYTKDNTVLHLYPSGRSADYTVDTATTVISPYAFGYSNVWNVNLPESLVEISEYAFYACNNLSSINIPDNVLQIGRYAFAEDWNLRAVYFNDTAKIPRLSYGAFSHTGLNSFTVPANVSTIAQGAFEGSPYLSSITFAENSKLESISAYMFDGCNNLQSITFMPGSKLTSIQAHGLEGMDNLTSVDFGDAKLENIDNFAFRFCYRLRTLNLPSTVKNVGRYAFYGCKSLFKLSLPESLEHIGSYAFLGTNDLDLYLASETMPAYLDENWDHGIRGYYTGVTNVETVGDYKYATLTSGNIAIIEYLGTDKTVDLTTVNLGAPISVIGGSAFEDSTVESIVLPETLTSIQAEAFQYAPLKNVIIPASVTFIGREAFAHTDVENLTFAEDSTLTVIEQYAFESTDKLTSVTIPASVTTLGTGVFQKSGLISVIFAEGIHLEEIPQNAFMGTKLTTVTLPDSVKTVNHNAFRDILTLKSVNFGNSDGIRLLSNVFYNTGLESLHIPANVTFIGEYCFVGLESLATITVDENNPNYKSVDGLLLTKSGRKLVTVPAGRTGSLTVPISVEEIGFGAFEKTALNEILVEPNANILTFGYRAFFGAKNLTTIHIPASVVSIDYYAFAYCEKLHTVTFAEGNQLKGIYEGAFCGDINLENITIPEAIVEISDFAFYGCSKITKLPISDTHNLKGIYDYAFAYTSIGGEFTIPDTLIDIGNYAFMGTKITKLTIPDTNKKDLVIGIGAFEECNQLVEVTLPFIGASYENNYISWFGYIFGAGVGEANSVYVPNSLKSVTITDGITFVGINGFFEIASAEKVNLPHSISVVYNEAFRGTTFNYELTNTILTIWIDEWGHHYKETRAGHFGVGISGSLNLSDEIQKIDAYAFENFNCLTSIALPRELYTLEYNTFAGCSSLAEVTMSDCLMSIEGDAFKGCSSLESVSFPETLTEIQGSAFAHCSSLSAIVLPDSVETIGWFAFAYCSSATSLRLPKNISCIEFGAFQECDKLLAADIPPSVSRIEAQAFNGCESLESILLPENVSFIGSTAFKDCKGITSIHSLGKVETIESRAFANCDALDECIFENGINSLGNNAFDNCINLKTVIFRGAVDIVGESAFFGCGSLNMISFEGPVGEIGASAFEGCVSLEYFSVPEGITTIRARTFYDCERLVEVVLPDSVSIIEERAFANCKSLTSAKFSKNLKKIGCGAFSYCEQLPTIILPDGLTHIEDNAFERCLNLADVTLPDSLIYIGHRAFFVCQNLISITLPANLEIVECDAFLSCVFLYTIYNNSSAEVSFAMFEDAKVIVERNGLERYPKDEFEYILTSDGFLFSYDGTQYSLLAYTGSDETITLPAKFEGNSYCLERFQGGQNIIVPAGVEIIGRSFAFNRTLVSIHLSEGVTFIGDLAFQDCVNLSSISISSSVKKIDGLPFSGCENLRTVEFRGELPELIPSTFSGTAATITAQPSSRYIEIDGVFYNAECSEILLVSPGVVKVQIPSGITDIGSCFSNCKFLTEIVIPEGITVLKAGAFCNCSSLVSVTLPQSLNSIDEMAFRWCSSLTTIDIPDSVNEIGRYAFSECSALERISLPQNLAAIAEYTFSDCISLREVILPCNLKNIDQCAFQRCSSLEEIDLPDSLECIANRAFECCFGLTSVYIPGSVERVGENAFADCTNLNTVTLGEGVSYVSCEAFSGCAELVTLSLPDTLRSIEYRALYGCEKLATVVVPNGAQEVDFSGCRGLLHVVLPNTITYAKFYYCENLKSVTVPSSMATLPAQMFHGCFNLQSVALQRGVVTIGREAFAACRNLKKIVIPDGVSSIGENAFSGCENLEEIIVPESVVEIGKDAFAGCSKLKNVPILQNAPEVNLSGLSNLTSIEIPHGVIKLTIESSTIKSITIPDTVVELNLHCENLLELNIPASVVTLNLSGCSSLRKLVIPENVTIIEDWAFSKCSSLQYIDFLGEVESIGAYAFEGCESLTKLILPDSVKTIGISAFQSCGYLYDLTIPKNLELFSTEIFYNTGLCVIRNRSEMEIPSEIFGQYDLGFIIDENGEMTKYDYWDNYAVTPDGFVYSTDAFGYTLVMYIGELETITLPEHINGQSYTIRGFRGAKHIVVPDGVTIMDENSFADPGLISIMLPDTIRTIQDNAFAQCTGLEEINLPDSVSQIGKYAFNLDWEKTKYYQDGIVVIDGWLLYVDEDLKYLPHINSIHSAVMSVYSQCYLLKLSVWEGAASNVETLIVNRYDDTDVFTSANVLNAQNIVVNLDTVGMLPPNIAIEGVAIFVKSLEEDLCWDDNFPGWNYGNPVVYGDEWHWVHFYDENGNILYSEPKLNSSIVRRPYYAPESTTLCEVTLIGWDLDGDGIPDPLPATTSQDLVARAVVEKNVKTFTVTFCDPETGEIYLQEIIPYGTIIQQPTAPHKDGYIFEGWAGFTEGMTVTGEITFEATWHQHAYLSSVTHPTCTADGYTTYTCYCGDSYVSDYVDPAGHAWSEWYDTTPGKEERTCGTCGETESRDKIPDYDVDGNGTVDQADVTLLMSVLVGNTETDVVFDFDFDGELTIYDCVLLMQQIG